MAVMAYTGPPPVFSTTGSVLMNNPLIPVSELSSAVRCPVRAFYNRSIPWVEPAEYTICKQISYHLGFPIEKNAVWDEICRVAPGIDPAYRYYCESCIDQCSNREWGVASEHDLFVKSDRFGICGTIDRVFTDTPYFSIIRSVKPPVSGIYSGDRIRVLGYALCLSELLGKELHGASIDYIPGGISRYYEIQPRDMRKFYSIRKILMNINAGCVPKKPLHAPCDGCSYKVRCDPGPTRLSDLF
jgi:CRISPR-associated exonuclease Cas4